MKSSKVSLKKIDNAAENKGSKIVTAWQFIKFLVVSLLATAVQFILLNTLNLIPAISELYSKEFSFWFFAYPVSVGGMGYFIASNTANIAAQIVAFFVNREKTFNSSANIAVTLPVYIIFTVGLIVLSAWLNPFLKEVFIELGLGEALSKNLATMVCSSVQFFLYFPVDKLLFKKKKEEK